MLLNQEAIEPAVACRYHITDFHLLRKWLQVEPDLLLLAVHVDVRVNLLLRLDILLLNRFLVIFVYNLPCTAINVDAFQAAKDQDVVLLHSEGVKVAELLRQSDLDEAPQVELSVQALDTVIKVSPGVSTSPTEDVHVLLLESATTGVDTLNVHRRVLAPRLGLHAERFHLFKATIAVIETAYDKDDDILVLLGRHRLSVWVSSLVRLVVWLSTADHLSALKHHLARLVVLILRVVLLVVSRNGLVPLV